MWFYQALDWHYHRCMWFYRALDLHYHIGVCGFTRLWTCTIIGECGFTRLWTGTTIYVNVVLPGFGLALLKCEQWFILSAPFIFLLVLILSISPFFPHSYLGTTA